LAMAELTASNVANQSNNPLSKKLNKILDNRFDSDKVSKLNQMINSALLLVYFRMTGGRLQYATPTYYEK